jgi:hypothetical protein
MIGRCNHGRGFRRMAATDPWYSVAKLRRAWSHLQTGENREYKPFVKASLNAFGWALEANLNKLSADIANDHYEPSPPLKCFWPKEDGTTRPFTVLTPRDLVAYQALVEEVARYAGPQISAFYGKSTFSHRLDSNPKRFYKPWRPLRRQFFDKQEDAFKDGYVWQLKFDLAGCYDVIDHDILWKELEQLAVPKELLDALFEWLNVWSETPRGRRARHGLPQGPLASAFLAECVLCYFDQQHGSKPEFRFFRYVDDMVVMAKSNTAAQYAEATLDLSAKELALLTQTKKLGIRELHSASEVRAEAEGSVIMVSGRRCASPTSPRHKAYKKVILDAFENGISRASDLRFALYRAAPDPDLVDPTWALFERAPFLRDIVCDYFAQFAGQTEASEIAARLRKFIAGGKLGFIFDFPAAIALSRAVELSDPADRPELIDACRALVADQNLHEFLRRTALRVLAQLKDNGPVLTSLRSADVADEFKGRLLPELRQVGFPKSSIEKTSNELVSSKNEEATLMAAYVIASANLKLTADPKAVGHVASAVLVDSGIIKDQVNPDRIRDVLTTRYGADPVDFVKLLGTKYDRAWQQLRAAQGRFERQPGQYVVAFDNFNQILLFRLLKTKLRGKFPKLQSSDQVWGGPVNSTDLKTRFPTVAAVFKQIHDVRSAGGQAHPEAAGGRPAKRVSYAERDAIFAKARAAYQEFCRAFAP